MRRRARGTCGMGMPMAGMMPPGMGMPMAGKMPPGAAMPMAGKMPPGAAMPMAGMMPPGVAMPMAGMMPGCHTVMGPVAQVCESAVPVTEMVPVTRMIPVTTVTPLPTGVMPQMYVGGMPAAPPVGKGFGVPPIPPMSGFGAFNTEAGAGAWGV